MSTIGDWSPDEFAARLEDRSRSRRSEQLAVPTSEREEYRRAAALLTNFDPALLRRPGDTAPGGAVAQLVNDCTAKGSSRRVRWALRPDVRDRALRSFSGPDAAMAMMEVNLEALPEDGTERYVLALLRRQRPSVGDLDVRGLVHLREAIAWLSVVPGMFGMPEEEEIATVLERQRLLEPLHTLTPQRFEGRADELDRLRAYIGAIPASTLRGRIGDVGRLLQQRLVGERDDLPIVVFGPGGIGKSTLVVQSLLAHITGHADRFPFVYVDFQRATVRLEEPFSLLAEMCRQLAIQYPPEALRFDALGASARVKARQQRARLEELRDLAQEVTVRANIGRDADREFHVTARSGDADAAGEFGELLSQAVAESAAHPPFVVVLDSFEEAQYRSSPVLDRIWAMFNALTAAYPRTRVVVAGRAPVGHPHVAIDEVPTVELGELDGEAARNLLVARGVAKPVARALVERIGGNPLSLQLAADVAAHMQSQGDEGRWVDTVPTKRRRLFGAVDDMLIQGVLYDRLLKHITNEDVRRLAHPGLVLRRITPDLIRDVLAPLCGVDVRDPERPQELFEEMARELDLVDQIAPSVLEHRLDVRRVMLRLLSEDRFAATREVEQRAVDFYSPSNDPHDRAEELYHRLRLGQGLRQIRARWLPEAGVHLAGAGDEMPKRAARLLTRLQQGAPDVPLDEDGQLEWEQRTSVEVENLLAQDFLGYALALLRARRPWTTCSPLHALYVEALQRRGSLAEARAYVAKALDADGITHCGDSYLELLLLSARVSAQAGDVQAADDDLMTAERTATSLGQDLEALGALLQRAQLHDTIAPENTEAEVALARRIDSLPDPLLASRAALFRTVAAEVGVREPRVLAHAIDLVGLPVSSDRTKSVLARAIATALPGQPAVAAVLGRLTRSGPERWETPRVEEVHDLLDDAADSGQLVGLAKELLAVRDETGALRAGIAEAMSEGQTDA